MTCGRLLAVVSDDVSLVISRHVLVEFCHSLAQLDDEPAELIAQFALEKVQPRMISFEEQVRCRNDAGAVSVRCRYGARTMPE